MLLLGAVAGLLCAEACYDCILQCSERISSGHHTVVGVSRLRPLCRRAIWVHATGLAGRMTGTGSA